VSAGIFPVELLSDGARCVNLASAFLPTLAIFFKLAGAVIFRATTFTPCDDGDRE
jgi:hypothetical protein